MADFHGDEALWFTERHLDRLRAKLGDDGALQYASGMATAVYSWVADKYGLDVALRMAKDLVEVVGLDFHIPPDEGQHGKN